LRCAFAVEVVGPKPDLYGAVAGVVVDQDAAEDELLRFEVLRGSFRRFSSIDAITQPLGAGPSRRRYERGRDKRQERSRRTATSLTRLLGVHVDGRREQARERRDGIGDAQPYT